MKIHSKPFIILSALLLIIGSSFSQSSNTRIFKTQNHNRLEITKLEKDTYLAKEYFGTVLLSDKIYYTHLKLEELDLKNFTSSRILLKDNKDVNNLTNYYESVLSKVYNYVYNINISNFRYYLSLYSITVICDSIISEFNKSVRFSYFKNDSLIYSVTKEYLKKGIKDYIITKQNDTAYYYNKNNVLWTKYSINPENEDVEQYEYKSPRLNYSSKLNKITNTKYFTFHNHNYLNSIKLQYGTGNNLDNFIVFLNSGDSLICRRTGEDQLLLKIANEGQRYLHITQKRNLNYDFISILTFEDNLNLLVDDFIENLGNSNYSIMLDSIGTGIALKDECGNFFPIQVVDIEKLYPCYSHYAKILKYAAECEYGLKIDNIEITTQKYFNISSKYFYSPICNKYDYQLFKATKYQEKNSFDFYNLHGKLICTHYSISNTDLPMFHQYLLPLNLQNGILGIIVCFNDTFILKNENGKKILFIPLPEELKNQTFDFKVSGRGIEILKKNNSAKIEIGYIDFDGTYIIKNKLINNFNANPVWSIFQSIPLAKYIPNSIIKDTLFFNSSKINAKIEIYDYKSRNDKDPKCIIFQDTAVVIGPNGVQIINWKKLLKISQIQLKVFSITNALVVFRDSNTLSVYNYRTMKWLVPQFRFKKALENNIYQVNNKYTQFNSLHTKIIISEADSIIFNSSFSLYKKGNFYGYAEKDKTIEIPFKIFFNKDLQPFYVENNKIKLLRDSIDFENIALPFIIEDPFTGKHNLVIAGKIIFEDWFKEIRVVNQDYYPLIESLLITEIFCINEQSRINYVLDGYDKKVRIYQGTEYYDKSKVEYTDSSLIYYFENDSINLSALGAKHIWKIEKDYIAICTRKLKTFSEAEHTTWNLMNVKTRKRLFEIKFPVSEFSKMNNYLALEYEDSGWFIYDENTNTPINKNAVKNLEAGNGYLKYKDNDSLIVIITANGIIKYPNYTLNSNYNPELGLIFYNKDTITIYQTSRNVIQSQTYFIENTEVINSIRSSNLFNNYPANKLGTLIMNFVYFSNIQGSNSPYQIHLKEKRNLVFPLITDSRHIVNGSLDELEMELNRNTIRDYNNKKTLIYPENGANIHNFTVKNGLHCFGTGRNMDGEFTVFIDTALSKVFKINLAELIDSSQIPNFNQYLYTKLKSIESLSFPCVPNSNFLPIFNNNFKIDFEEDQVHLYENERKRYSKSIISIDKKDFIKFISKEYLKYF